MNMGGGSCSITKCFHYVLSSSRMPDLKRDRLDLNFKTQTLGISVMKPKASKYNCKTNFTSSPPIIELLLGLFFVLVILSEWNPTKLLLGLSWIYDPICTRVHDRRGFPLIKQLRMLLSVWPDWAIYCTLGDFSKPVATIILPKQARF